MRLVMEGPGVGEIRRASVAVCAAIEIVFGGHQPLCGPLPQPLGDAWARLGDVPRAEVWRHNDHSRGVSVKELCLLGLSILDRAICMQGSKSQPTFRCEVNTYSFLCGIRVLLVSSTL